jgi:hypothetical protein
LRCNPKWKWWSPRWMKTSSHQLQKLGKWQTFGRQWWLEGRVYGWLFFAFVFFCFLQIMVDGFVMVIASFHGNRCLEFFSYSFLVCVSSFCVVVWRMWTMEHMGPIVYVLCVKPYQLVGLSSWSISCTMKLDQLVAPSSWLTHSQVPGWTHLRVHQSVVAESWDSEGAPDFQL